jgi:hypothetical protein
VNQEESAASNETPVNTEQEAPVTEQPVESQATQEPVQREKEPVQDLDSIDDRGVSWKNRAMEAERKFNEVPNIIRQTVEEVITKQQKPPEYTIDQLEAYALEKPEYRPWVENQKAMIIQRNLEKTWDEKLQVVEKKTQETQIRQQSEQWVTNHPEFKDCFVNDAYGNKVWNMSNPLTQLMGNYLNQIDTTTGKHIKDRPDGLTVAAKLAYADYALNSKPKVGAQVNQLKKDLRKVQKQTMVQGSGNPVPQATKNDVRKNLDSYNKTYNKQDISNATKAYLAAAGLLKES